MSTADQVLMILREEAIVCGGILRNAEYLAVKIAEALEDPRPEGRSNSAERSDSGIRVGNLRRRWRHMKRGSTYIEIGRGKLQSADEITEGARLVVYQCEADGRLWLRPEGEFEDGRFEEIDAP